MTRRLPLCAWCGGSLARRDYIIVTFRALPRKPVVGYHPDCARTDPAWKAYESQRDDFGVGTPAAANDLLDVVACRAANEYPGSSS